MKECALQAISDAISAARAESIADICCGSGISGSFGLDIDIAALRQAERPAINADAHMLPLKDRAADAAICFEGLHHLKEPYAALGEMSRISRKAVVFFEPLDVFATRAAVSLGIAKRKEGRDKVQRLNAEKTIGLLNALGFKDVKMQRQWYFSPNSKLNRIVDRKLPAAAIQKLMHLLNILLPSLGNRALFVATR